MVRHFVVITSAYKSGLRIALDYLYDEVSMETIRSDLERIKVESSDNIVISTHLVTAETDQWDSVVKMDSFFDGISIVRDVSEFVEIANQDGKITGRDVAEYILCKVRHCTHLQLEKLVYLCFADYLCTTKEPLFDNKIYAFKNGPVVSDVYEEYKQYGKNQISGRNLNYDLPYRSRLLCSSNGVTKIATIDNVIDMYGKMSAGQLVDKTHKKKSPWKMTYDGTRYKVIPNEIILQYHCNE